MGKENKVLGIYFACDLLEHLKENSQSLWPQFMPTVMQALTDTEADQRTAAAYAVNLAARIPAFAEASPQVFGVLNQILSSAKPKKRDEKGKLAWDNAVAALLSMAHRQGAQCPPQISAWQVVISKLPIRDDEDEAKKVHEKVADLVLEQNQGLLGGAEGAHLGKVLKIFKLLPQAAIASNVSAFSEKQQKKIEKMH